MNTANETILVVGGTGKTGRRIAERLWDRGIPVRIASRAATPPFDWENPASWGPALQDIKAAYISFYPDLAIPGAADTVRAFARQAVASGVQRLVLLSGRGEEGALAGEQAVQESGAEWTIVRCSWFCQNFSENYLLDAVLAGEITLPVGDVGEPFVDADDIADVAVAALTGSGHAGQIYELTGPRLLTFAEATAELAAAAGREIRYTEVPLADYTGTLAQQQVPAEFVELLVYLFGEVLDGRNAHVSDGVQRALGRPPKDFAAYARDAAASGVFGAQSAHAKEAVSG
ncbi:NAD(P)H azoreductase [Andreprevotia sp. IGB-42]|uniref:NAD(P)H-binding protein n=1 Tax=Andreprevotia sp. IGB-42 TaxID=2497473 RepID=UPI0013597338|nr:NAD(P)H-binding protein [Andreprevotia sp. IGB-42]KAF0813696.1 NAD(P)H azoreductase [Andreprevotia sp. IGB-42]